MWPIRSGATPTRVAIREFNERVARDTRVDVTLLTVGDGVTLVRKLPA